MLAFKDLNLEAVETQLTTVSRDSRIVEAETFARWTPEMARSARELGSHWDIMAPSREIDCLLLDLFPIAKTDLQKRDKLRRIAVARLALDHFCVGDDLPNCIRSLFADFFQRLAAFVSDGGKKYDDEYFGKDVRYALGMTLPGGALQFDVASHIGPKLIARDIKRTRSLRAFEFYLGKGAWRRWYNEHIDLRAMREFNPQGWTDHCARMAEMLALNPDSAGIIGTGWFYDPAVADVSPGLGYIQKTQTRYGAFLIRIGTAAHHTENALYRSAARRKLYEEGKYLPTCYMCAWPRRALLAWAKRLKTDPSVGFGVTPEAKPSKVPETVPRAARAADPHLNAA